LASPSTSPVLSAVRRLVSTWLSGICGIFWQPSKVVKKFAGNKKVHVLSYGISDKAQELEIILEDNSSSVFDIKAPHSKKEKIQLVKFSEEMQRLNIKKIDLLKINSEGGEYGLLANALETGWLQRITNIQVQFHDFVPEAYQQMRKLQQEMLKTHYPTYQYDFVWDNWRLRGKDEGKDLLKFYLSELQLERERFALLGQQYDDLIEKVPHLENRITDLEAETTWAKDKLAHTEHMLSSLENSRGVRALRTMRLPLKWLVRRVKKIT